MAMEKVTSKMDELLKDFEVPAKNSSEEALKRWRKAVWLVRNRCRRFRMVADLNKRSELALKRRTIQGNFLELSLAEKRQKREIGYLEEKSVFLHLEEAWGSNMLRCANEITWKFFFRRKHVAFVP